MPGTRQRSWPSATARGCSRRSTASRRWATSASRWWPTSAPYQRRKLWLLNGPHSALAYGGLVAGCETIAEAADAPRRVARSSPATSTTSSRWPTLPDGRAFAEDALRRFRNPALGHTCRQVGTDGSHKLPQRLLPVVAEREARGLPTDRFATVVAWWAAAFGESPSGTLGRLAHQGADLLREAT